MNPLVILSQVFFVLTPWCCMVTGVAATNFIIFSLMQPGFEPMIYHTAWTHDLPHSLNPWSTIRLEPMIYHTRDKHTNPILLSFWPNQGLNPRSTTLETITLTITPPMNPRSTTLETSTLTITSNMWFRRCLLSNPTIKKYLFQLFPLTNNNRCCYS